MTDENELWFPRDKDFDPSEIQSGSESVREPEATGSLVVQLNTAKTSKPDGGWGWMVCAATFLVNFIVFGIHNSFGVIYANLLDELQLGEAETGMSLHKFIYI